MAVAHSYCYACESFASCWCADYVRASYVVADEARVACVTFAAGLGAV